MKKLKQQRFKARGALVSTSLLSIVASGCFSVGLNNTTPVDSGPIVVSSTPPGLKMATLAGGRTGGGFWDGVGTDSRIYAAEGIHYLDGKLYVMQAVFDSLRLITLSSGAVTTLAGSRVKPRGAEDGIGTDATFNYAYGVCADTTHVYVVGTSDQTIRQYNIATRAVTTLAGLAGTGGAVNATGAAARFYYPSDCHSDGTNLFVTDSGNHAIRKIVISTGVVTTWAGQLGASGTTDAIGAAARFNYPAKITTDGTNFYVSDANNNKIRKIVLADATVSTLAGSGVAGNADGTGALATFSFPYGITTDGTNVYVSANTAIRQIVISSGVVTTIAGTSGTTGYEDGVGGAVKFINIYNELAYDGSGALYISESYGTTIRKMVLATGVVSSPYGESSDSGSADGTGTAARFNNPGGYGATGMVTDGTYIYVADSSNNTIRKIHYATGVVTTLAGLAGSAGGTDGTGAAARFSSPRGVALVGGFLYVTDTWGYTIRKVDIATGAVTTLAGTYNASGGTNAVGAAARFQWPTGVATDGTYLYVTDEYNYSIRKITIADGTVTTLAGLNGASGAVDGTGGAARFNVPAAAVIVGTNLYVSDYYNCTIRKVELGTGVVTTLAGTPGSCSYADLTGANARFIAPWGITADDSSLFVADNLAIRKVSISTGTVTTYAGLAHIGYGKDTYETTPLTSTTPIGDVASLLYSSEWGLLFTTSTNIKRIYTE